MVYFYWLAIFILILLGNIQKLKFEISKEMCFIILYIFLYFFSPTVAGRLMEIFVIFIFIWLNSKVSLRLFYLLSFSYFYSFLGKSLYTKLFWFLKHSKILMILPALSRGGAERQCLTLAKELKKK